MTEFQLSPFKKSLLNSQPLARSNNGIISTFYDPEDGYKSINSGFAGVIEQNEKLTLAIESDRESDVKIEEETISTFYNVSKKRQEIIYYLLPRDLECYWGMLKSRKLVNDFKGQKVSQTSN